MQINSPKSIGKVGKTILEANKSERDINQTNEQILKMILGIQAIILQYVNGQIDNETIEESEE